MSLLLIPAATWKGFQGHEKSFRGAYRVSRNTGGLKADCQDGVSP